MESNALNRREYKRQYSIANKERLNEQARRWHKSNPQYSLYLSARNRAQRFKLDFDLSPEDIIIPDVCPVLGINILPKQGKRTNNTHSLDRIDNSRGYVKGNVAVISWRANRLKADASLAELEKLTEYVRKSLTL